MFHHGINAKFLLHMVLQAVIGQQGELLNNKPDYHMMLKSDHNKVIPLHM